MNRKWNELNQIRGEWDEWNPACVMGVGGVQKKSNEIFPIFIFALFALSFSLHSLLALHVYSIKLHRELKFIMFDHLSEPMNRRHRVATGGALFNEKRDRIEKFS